MPKCGPGGRIPLYKEKKGRNFEHWFFGVPLPCEKLSSWERTHTPKPDFEEAIRSAVFFQLTEWNPFHPNGAPALNLYRTVFFILTGYNLTEIAKMTTEKRAELPVISEDHLSVCEVYEKLGLFLAPPELDYHHGVDCFFYFLHQKVFVTVDITTDESKFCQSNVLLSKRMAENKVMMRATAKYIASLLLFHYKRKAKK